jgi:uncharacterized protein YeaO (DUF488 family)
MKNRMFLSLLFGLIVFSNSIFGHCQVPCGIYADEVVFGELATDIATIEKAMVQINTLDPEDVQNRHQLVRWINNKESHAQNIQDTISAYFLAQRIKLEMKESDAERYWTLVELAHKITVVAMKCKQGTDVANAKVLAEALHDFQHAYGHEHH